MHSAVDNQQGERTVEIHVVGVVVSAVLGLARHNRLRGVVGKPTKPCASCGRLVLTEAATCEHCNARLVAPALVDPSPWNRW
jgi:hypothetical protein